MSETLTARPLEGTGSPVRPAGCEDLRPWTYWVIFGLLLTAGLAIRLTSLAPFPFFCDVPVQVEAIQSGRFIIQFPGYAPYHLVIGHLANLSGLSVFTVLWLFSLVCEQGSNVYIILAARKAAGLGFSLLAGVIVCFGLYSVYFSIVGASYTTDLLCVAGMLYHGWEFMRRQRSFHFLVALAWVCFGILMRPLSAGFCVFGLGFLLWRDRRLDLAAVTFVALAATAALFLGLSLPYYGSFSAFKQAAAGPASALQGTQWRNVATNLIRFTGLPLYGFHLWLGLCVVAAAKGWRDRKRPELWFLVLTVGPYCLLLARYLPHAGYYCLVLPAIVLFPACFWSSSLGFERSNLAWFAAALILVFGLQWYAARPIPVRNVATALISSYFMQTSRAGVEGGLADGLTATLLKRNVQIDAIPEQDRIETAGKLGIVLPTPTNMPPVGGKTNP